MVKIPPIRPRKNIENTAVKKTAKNVMIENPRYLTKLFLRYEKITEVVMVSLCK